MNASNFWNKVDKSSGCWIWKGAGDRYGHVAFQGRFVKAHRFAYMITKGTIPEGMCVCHSCDTPRCVNPDHLWLGTPKDNAEDCSRKKRWQNQKGELNNACKWSDAQIAEIRRRVASGETQESVRKDFGMSSANICVVVNNKNRVLA